MNIYSRKGRRTMTTIIVVILVLAMVITLLSI